MTGYERIDRHGHRVPADPVWTLEDRRRMRKERLLENARDWLGVIAVIAILIWIGGQ